MNQTPVALLIITCSGAAICFAMANRKGDNADLWLYGGIALVVLTLYIAALILVERDIAFKAVEAITAIRYESVAVAHAISGMSEKQLQAFQTRYIIEPRAVVIRSKGIELDSDWVISYLQKSEASFPELPAIRRVDWDTLEYQRQDALRHWLRTTLRTQARDGQADVWVNGHDPRNTLVALGYEE